MAKKLSAKEIKELITENLENFKQEELNGAYILIEEDRHKRIEYLIEELEEYLADTMQKLFERLDLLYAQYSTDLEDIEGLGFLNTPLSRAKQRSFKRDLKDLLTLIEADEVLLDSDYRELIESGQTNATILDYFMLPAIVELETLFWQIEERLREFYKEETKEAINRSTFEIFLVLGIGYELSLDTDDITSRIWRDNQNDWIKTLWYNKRTAVGNLRRYVLANAYGTNGKEFTKDNIERLMNARGNALKRMVTGDTTFFNEQAHEDLMRELDIGRSEFVAVLDERTSDICRDMDGTIVDNDNIREGENAPPMHENCRSMLVPYLKDLADSDFSTRAARNQETGKTYFVSDKLTYREWEKEHSIK